MADASYFREKAEQAFRLARQNTDPMLVASLILLAQHNIEKADAIDGAVLGEDSEGVDRN
jgi:hypothetical protein